jgi:hypothetical protein
MKGKRDKDKSNDGFLFYQSGFSLTFAFYLFTFYL